MNTRPNGGRRWALSPIDSRSHLLAEAEGVPVGMVVTECGQLLACTVTTSPHPPTGLWCSTCARGAGQAGVQRPMSDVDLVAVVSPELVASLVLRLACDGGVAKVGDCYLDGGLPTPGYLAGVFDGLINAGLLVLGDEDLSGMRQVRVTEAGRARYAQLRDPRPRAGLWVPEPRFPTTGPTAVGRRSSTWEPAAGTVPDPVRVRGPVMHWARCPTDGLLHAIAPIDIAQAAARGYAEALCGHELSAEGLAIQDVPSGALCLPCVLAAINAWIGSLFDNEHRAATVAQLAAAGSSTSDNARMEQSRNRLSDAEKRLRRLQQAIEAGANPAALVDALNRAEEERQAACADLDWIPAGRVLSHADVAAMIDELGDVGQALDRADPAGLEALYSALRLEMLYDASSKTVDVTIRPAGRGSARVRGGT